MPPRALLFCNTSPAEHSFVPCKPFHFETKNSIKKLICVSVRFGDLLFLFLFFLNGRIGQIQWAPKSSQKLIPGAKKILKSTRLRYFWRTPVFCAVGTHWRLLLNGHFLMAIGSCSVFPAFLRAHYCFITMFYKNCLLLVS